MDRKIKILWYFSDKFGCGTYRCYVPAYGLQESGHFDNEFIAHKAIEMGGLWAEDTACRDIVIFQRAVDPEFVKIAQYCKRLGILMFFEMDDNLFDIPKRNPASWYWNNRPVQRCLKKMLSLVDGVIVSTEALKRETEKILQGIGTPKPLYLCPNHLLQIIWGEETLGHISPHDNGDSLVIGWQGSSTHDVDFKVALPALNRILLAFPKVTIRFFGNVPSSVHDIIPPERFQWTKGVIFERYPCVLKYINFDIGIAPLTDSKFNRAKSNLKWLEYAAVKIPCVASKVYPYSKSIRHGVDGFLATTDQEWFDCLCTLLKDAELRRKVGEEAYRSAWAGWGLENYSYWEAAFREMLETNSRWKTLVSSGPAPTEIQNQELNV